MHLSPSLVGRLLLFYLQLYIAAEARLRQTTRTARLWLSEGAWDASALSMVAVIYWDGSAPPAAQHCIGCLLAYARPLAAYAALLCHQNGGRTLQHMSASKCSVHGQVQRMLLSPWYWEHRPALVAQRRRQVAYSAASW